MTADSSVSVVAVTGASGFVGFRFLQELEAMNTLDRLVAIDRKPLPRPTPQHPFPPAGREPASNPCIPAGFRGRRGASWPSTYKKGALPRRPSPYAETTSSDWKTCCGSPRRARVKAVIYLSSHTIYGAHADNPIPITEEREPRPLPNFQYGQTKFLSEQRLLKFAEENPDVIVTILRCCMVMGPEGGSRVTQGFDKPALLKIAGANPPLQFIHNADLARILAMLSVNPQPGTFNLAGKGVLKYGDAAKIMGKRLVALPSSFAYPVVDATWKFGVQKDASSIGLNFIRYPVIMATGRLRQATGYKFRYTAKEAVTAFAASNVLLRQPTTAVFSP